MIAVAAHELDLAASAANVPADIAEDARLIRSQVDRCREILDQMSGRADASVAHEAQTLAADRVVAATLATFPAAGPRARASVGESGRAAGEGTRSKPRREPCARWSRTRWRRRQVRRPSISGRDRSSSRSASIVDHGVGMTPTRLQHAGEPFFTTKPAGAGFGLGLFLARTFAERWGGRSTLTSSPAAGTTATCCCRPVFEGRQP